MARIGAVLWKLTALVVLLATPAWATNGAGEAVYGSATVLYLAFGALFTAAQVVPPLLLVGALAVLFVTKVARARRAQPDAEGCVGEAV